MTKVQIAHLQPGQRIEAREVYPGLILLVTRVRNVTKRIVETVWKDGRAITEDRNEYSVEVSIESPYGLICRFISRDNKAYYEVPKTGLKEGEHEFDGLVILHP